VNTTIQNFSRVKTRAIRKRAIAGLAGAAIAIIALLAGASGVTAHGPDPIFSGRWNQNQALQYSWRSGAVPGAIYQASIRAAGADASASRGSQAATFSYASGAPNLIGYGTGATCSPAGLACFTRSPTSSFTMWMREQGHRFDWGSLRWCQAYASWPDGCFDAENIMLDEFGHVEILAHHYTYANESDYLDALVQTVSHAKPRAGWNAHALGRCDVASLQIQYDMPSWSARYSTCLSLATTLGLSATPTSIARGGSTTLTATLKVADNSAYVRLALNPVASRSVTLQRRPAGTTTWTTVGPMASGATSGTYRTTLSLQARTEFRAVFSKPVEEGLLAATSPVIAVAVGP
jgi:hypothetical protein